MSFDDRDSSKIIVALDYDNKKEAIEMAKCLDPNLCKLKVGLELFTSCGPEIIQDLHALGYKIFLDLKFHDITNTVIKSCLAASNLGVWMINVHSSGGKNMMTKCKNEIFKSNKKILILGVTILTSMNENEIREVGYTDNLKDQVLKMAKLCHESKLDGVVCSSQESKLIKSQFKENFICVCPGIRNVDDKNNDQKRISTPKVAATSGADYIVVGRPITKSSDPLASLIAIKKEFDESVHNII